MLLTNKLKSLTLLAFVFFLNVCSASVLKISSFGNKTELILINNIATENEKTKFNQQIRQASFQIPDIYLITSEDICIDCSNYIKINSLEKYSNKYAIDIDLVKDGRKTHILYDLRDESKAMSEFLNLIFAHFLNYDPMLDKEILYLYNKDSKRIAAKIDRFSQKEEEIINSNKITPYNPTVVYGTNYLMFANTANGKLELSMLDLSSKKFLFFPKFANAYGIISNFNKYLYFFNVEKKKVVAYEMNVAKMTYKELFKDDATLIDLYKRNNDIITYVKYGDLYEHRSFLRDRKIFLNQEQQIYDVSYSKDERYLLFVQSFGDEKNLILKDLITGEEKTLAAAYQISSPRFSENGHDILFTQKNNAYNKSFIKCIDVNANVLFEIKKADYNLEEARWI